MKLTHLAIAAAAMFGFGLGAAPVLAQPGPPPGHGMNRPGPDRGPGMHRPRPRPHVRPHHRRKRVCNTVWRHGHRERRCYYR